jgi:Ni,Fe-hydrogenase III large subunit
LPPEGIDWSRMVPTRRVWLEDIGGDHHARLEFLADQGLRLVMVDRSSSMGETLHFSNPKDRETLHLRAGGGQSLLAAAVKYFPAANRWIELLQGEENENARQRPAAGTLVRAGLVLEVEGGYVRQVREAWRDYPQGVLCGVKASQASSLLGREKGEEGIALSLSFLQALEDARGMNIPSAAIALRAVLLESARALAHLEWISAAASALGRQRTSAGCDGLRLELEAGLDEWLGETRGRGWIVPGGVREDFPLEGAASLRERIAGVAMAWQKLSPRTMALPVPGWAEKRSRSLPAEAEKSAWVGPLARAAGLEVDVRQEEPGIYPVVVWESAVVPSGAGMLRRMLALRTREVTSSLEVVQRILAEPPDAPLLVKRGRGGRGEGFGRCEGPQGEVCCHLALEKGQVSFIAFSLPHELNRSAARILAGRRLDEAGILSLLWEPRPSPRASP